MAGDDLAIGVSEGTNVGAILDLFLQFYNLHGIIERAKGKITTP
jgi:hypothetical protein